jgi:hypothetical protein
MPPRRGSTSTSSTSRSRPGGVRGLFELDGIPAGLSNVVVAISVRADATREDLERIGLLTTRTSAVFNSLAHPIPIELSVRRI